MISYETIRLKIRNKVYIPMTCKFRKRKLVHEDFTIISNNCWGGTVYESYGIKKMSPTIGMFILPDDYLKFINNLYYYVHLPLEFIRPDDSKWRKVLEHKSNWNTYLIARLDDIELHMLHYRNKEEAVRKWENRVKRINWNRIIYKFNDQNGATKEHIIQFVNSSLNNKLCFVVKEDMIIDGSVIFIRQFEDKTNGIKASREPFGKSKYIDVTRYINEI